MTKPTLPVQQVTQRWVNCSLASVSAAWRLRALEREIRRIGTKGLHVQERRDLYRGSVWRNRGRERRMMAQKSTIGEHLHTDCMFTCVANCCWRNSFREPISRGPDLRDWGDATQHLFPGSLLYARGREGSRSALTNFYISFDPHELVDRVDDKNLVK